MAEPRAIELHQHRHKAGGVDTPSPAFEPRPPEPLPDGPHPAGGHAPSAPVSRPLLRTSRTRRLWPLLTGLTAIASALGVGHHWYQRQHMESRHPAPETSPPGAGGAPFSLHAAWRDVARRKTSAQGLEPTRETPVISVLDDPPHGPPASTPSAAALLAERMATAGASDTSATPPAIEEQAAATPPQAAIGAEPPPEMNNSETPAARAETSSEHVPATAPDAVPTRRHQPLPAAMLERAPGMTGLGGPQAIAGGTGSRPAAGQPHRTAPPLPAPQSRSARDAVARTVGTSGAPAALGGPRPRKPYSRAPVLAPAARPAEFPPNDPTIFKRIERTMP